MGSILDRIHGIAAEMGPIPMNRAGQTETMTHFSEMLPSNLNFNMLSRQEIRFLGFEPEPS